MEKNYYWDMAVSKDLPRKLANSNQSIAIMGELVGDGIESNRHGYPKGQRDFFVFAVFDIDNQTLWDPKIVEDFARDLEPSACAGAHLRHDPQPARHATRISRSVRI